MKKHLLQFSFLVLLTFMFFACKKSSDATPNQPPNAFTVSIKQVGTSLLLSWTKAKDPDGDAVTYTVVSKDTLARNINDTTYSITNVPYATNIAGTIIAKDAKGAKTQATFSITTGADPYVAIPDVNFEYALIYRKIDDVKDGKLLKSSAEKVTKLDVFDLDITNLQGIEAFVNLKELDCSSNRSLRNLDVSKNTALIYLACNGDNLSSLDVSKNIALQKLVFSFNPIKSLDISKNTALQYLDCYGNLLSSLDISKNTVLQTLFCSGNQLISLDVSKNALLKDLKCTLNNIQNICVSTLSQPTSNWVKDDNATYKVCN